MILTVPNGTGSLPLNAKWRERFIENSEPERPRLRDTPWRQGINFQSPDQDHLLCEFIDGTHDYVIEGTLGTIPYFVIASWSAPCRLMRATAIGRITVWRVLQSSPRRLTHDGFSSKQYAELMKRVNLKS